MTESIDQQWAQIDSKENQAQSFFYPVQEDRSERKGIPKDIVKGMRKAIIEFDMLEPGDKVLVGLSGGKDSSLLLYALADLVKHIPWKVELGVIHIDLGFRHQDDMDYAPIAKLAEGAGLPLLVQRLDMSQDILHNEEQNPCSRCSYWRRALIHNYAKEHGYNKVAFAHHYNDAVETWLMGLLYSGQLGTFLPKTYLDRTEVTVIRPFVYIREQEIVSAVNKLGIQPAASPCPLDGYTQRTKVKELIRDLCKENPLVFSHLASSMREGKRRNMWPAPLDRDVLRTKNLQFWQEQ